MAKLTFCAIGLAILLGFAAAPSAEFYKYVDENGTIHFTDDYNKVPVDQREGVQGYEEVISESDDTDAAAQQAGAHTESTGDPQDQAQAYSFDRKMTELNQRKAELTAEYEALMEENRQLKEARKSIKTKADAEKYNESVRSLNTRLEEHDRKRKAFYSEVEDYNKRVAEINQKANAGDPGN